MTQKFGDKYDLKLSMVEKFDLFLEIDFFLLNTFHYFFHRLVFLETRTLKHGKWNLVVDIFRFYRYIYI